MEYNYPQAYREKVIRELYEAVWAAESVLGGALVGKVTYDATQDKGAFLAASKALYEEGLQKPEFDVHSLDTEKIAKSYTESSWFPKSWTSVADSLRDAHDMRPDEEK